MRIADVPEDTLAVLYWQRAQHREMFERAGGVWAPGMKPTAENHIARMAWEASCAAETELRLFLWMESLANAG